MFFRKSKPVQEPLTEEEKLLNEYGKHKGQNTADEYFSALSLVEYYYKLREDAQSLEKCIKYCNVCIYLLDTPQMQACIFPPEEDANGIRIPAFRHLITINEKKKNYLAAYNLCLNAIKYSPNRAEELEYYTNKAEKLKVKLNA